MRQYPPPPAAWHSPRWAASGSGSGSSVGVGVGLGVGVRVGVSVGVGVGVGVVVPRVRTSWGLLVPSRESKTTPSLDWGSSTKPTAPLPVTALVTSYSTQVPPAERPLVIEHPAAWRRAIVPGDAGLTPTGAGGLHVGTVLRAAVRLHPQPQRGLCTGPLTPLTEKRR